MVHELEAKDDLGREGQDLSPLILVGKEAQKESTEENAEGEVGSLHLT